MNILVLLNLFILVFLISVTGVVIYLYMVVRDGLLDNSKIKETIIDTPQFPSSGFILTDTLDELATDQGRHLVRIESRTGDTDVLVLRASSTNLIFQAGAYSFEIDNIIPDEINTYVVAKSELFYHLGVWLRRLHLEKQQP